MVSEEIAVKIKELTELYNEIRALRDNLITLSQEESDEKLVEKLTRLVDKKLIDRLAWLHNRIETPDTSRQ